MLEVLSLSKEGYRHLELPLWSSSDGDCSQALRTLSLLSILVSFILRDKFVFDTPLISFSLPHSIQPSMNQNCFVHYFLLDMVQVVLPCVEVMVIFPAVESSETIILKCKL